MTGVHNDKARYIEETLSSVGARLADAEQLHQQAIASIVQVTAQLHTAQEQISDLYIQLGELLGLAPPRDIISQEVRSRLQTFGGKDRKPT